ncbi:MAG: YeeE/YedE family protein, partial [Pelagibacteraceae bacterium]|nr:YeeE/YedE family protein [Pelagibacteraceae bacterium]
MSKIISLISGIIFGVGLAISNMINPAKVLGFLNFFGQWDPSLIFVMIGAILTSAPFFFLFRNKNKPLFAEIFSIPKTKIVDSKLIAGSSLFGVGWGLVGFCPGPAIASLALANGYAIFFLISMFGGF